MGVADAILQKPGPLQDDEWALVRIHATAGRAVVSAAGLEVAALWVFHHREHVNGRGCPDGLRGEAIPLESRIILVADAFEAMTSERPYRAARAVDEAVAELVR